MEGLALLLDRLRRAGCRMDLIRRFSATLPQRDPRYAQALAQWLDTGEPPCLAAQGITTLDIMRHLGIDYPHAVSLLMRLEEDPAGTLPVLSSVIHRLKDGGAPNRR